MKALKILAMALPAVALTACTIHRADAPPPLTGPSGSATTITVAATPDSISQDGGSQSTIRVTAIGPNGRPLPNLPLRLDMAVNGVPQDFGTLSARTVATNADGIATAVFTAPPNNPAFSGTCRNLPGTCVEIVATPIGSGFDGSAPQSTQVRLVPPGVILPPASTPIASFTISPTPVTANVPVVLDASASQPGAGATQITDFSWNFGDGSTGTGRTVSHTFTSGATHTVTLTVTNDRGLSASTTQAISVGIAAAPTASFTFSPTTVRAGVTSVNFNASSSTAANGRTIVSYRWDFGDGMTATGVSPVKPPYAAANDYVVTLTVTDDVGQTGVTSATITVAP
jgi:PKD repeat protein